MTKIRTNDAFWKNYGSRFRAHILAFLESLDLDFDFNNQKILVSTSAGVDSMALLDVFVKANKSKKFKIEVLHFNHQTRKDENHKEALLVESYASDHDLPFHLKTFNLCLDQKNFEHRARLLRKACYQKFINEGYVVLCGHHLDDSFEWHLMQSFKHSGVSSLGIPVYSDGIIRPFMCVSKKHIYQYARIEGVTFLEDSSNENIKFERNYFREKILKEILNKYPHALKHYAKKSNEMAFLLKQHALTKKSKLFISVDTFGGVTLKSDYFLEHTKEIKEQIYTLSNKVRGLVDEELKKLLTLQSQLLSDPKILSQKGPLRGPHQFSGSVWAYIDRDVIYLTSTEVRKKLSEYDQQVFNFLSIKTQIPDVLVTSHFPKLFIGDKQLLKKTSKFIHPLLEQTCLFMKRNGISFCYFANLDEKIQQNLVYSAVILDSSVLDL